MASHARPHLPRSRRALPLGVVAATALAVTSSAAAAPGDLRTVAGGYGAGQAQGVGLVPNGLAVAGGALVVGDGQNGVVRRVDVGSGETDVLVGTGAAGGPGTNGLTGLNGRLTPLPGLAASVAGPQAVAAAPGGDLVFSVGSGGTIRRWSAAGGTVTRIAGTGAFSSAAPGDGGPAVAAQFGLVQGLVVDAEGTVFLSDTSANRVRRIATDGTVDTVAGGGSAVGDGGPASAARVLAPRGLALTAAGDLLIAESGGHRVRRIAAVDGRVGPAGTIDTVVGDGTAATDGTLGDGGPATAGRLNGPTAVAVLPGGAFVVAEGTGRRLRHIAAGASPRIATVPVGTLDGPTALAVRGSRVYVTETGTGSRRVQEIALDAATGALASGTAPRVVAGNGSLGFAGQRSPAVEAQLLGPRSLTVAPDGAVHVVDTGNGRLRRIDPTDGRIATVAGSGASCSAAADPTCVGDVPAAEARFARPWDAAVAADGTAYVLESNALISRVSRRDPTTGRVTPVAGGAVGFAGDGSSDPTSVRMNEAQGLALAAGDRALFVADTNNHRVRRIDLASGEVSTVAGTGAGATTGDGGPAVAAAVRAPIDVVVAPDGRLLVSTDGRVRRIDPATGSIETVAGGGAADGTAAQRASFDSARGIALGPDGTIAVADATAGVVWTVAADGSSVRRAAGVEDENGFDGDAGRADASRLSSPYAVAYRPDGTLLVADTANNRLRAVEGPAPADPPPVGGPAPVEIPGPVLEVPGPERLVPGPERLVAGPERLVPGPTRALPRPIVGRPRVTAPTRLTAARLTSGVRVRTVVRRATRLRVDLVVSGATARRLGLGTTTAELRLARAGMRVARDGTATVLLRPDTRTRRVLRRLASPRSFVVRLRATASRPGAEARASHRTVRVRRR